MESRSQLRHSLRVLPLALILTTGCALPEGALPGLDVRSVSVREVDWEGVSLAVALEVENPLPLDVRVLGIRYAVTVEGAAVLQGERVEDLVIAGRETSAITLPLRLEHAAIWEVARSLPTQDVLDYAVSGEVQLDTPIGPRSLPVSYAGSLPLVRAPEVSVDHLEVVNLDLATLSADIELRLRVANRLDRVLRLTDLRYALSLGRHPVLSGRRADLGAATPGGVVLGLPVRVELAAVPRFIWDALSGQGPLEVGLRGELQVVTPLGSLPLSLDVTRGLWPR
jgi:LEA14-like dessication related protein